MSKLIGYTTDHMSSSLENYSSFKVIEEGGKEYYCYTHFDNAKKFSNDFKPCHKVELIGDKLEAGSLYQYDGKFVVDLWRWLHENET